TLHWLYGTLLRHRHRKRFDSSGSGTAARSREGAKDCTLVRRMAGSSRAIWSWCGGSVKLTPSHRLYGLGAILLVALTICSRNFSRTGEPALSIPLAVAGVAYALAIRE